MLYEVITPDIVLALENRVSWMGHEPLLATNGKDALRLIQQEQPDLVLLDIQLPIFSGIEVLQQVHDLSRKDGAQDNQSVVAEGPLVPPIIMLTAFGTIEQAVKAMQLRITSYNVCYTKLLRAWRRAAR